MRYIGKVRVGVGPLRGAAISKREQGECAARISARVQTAGEIAVGSWAYNESWRLMMQRKKGRGELVESRGAAARRKAVREERIWQAVRVPGLASKVQLRHLRRHQDQGSSPGLPVFGCWNCRAKMWRGQQAAFCVHLRALGMTRQNMWCVHGVSRILA